jgi:uncharacterized protein with gpF-like domain
MANDRELRLQRRIALLLERRYARRFRLEIRRASMVLIGGYKENGQLPVASFVHERNMEMIIGELAERAVAAFGDRILNASIPVYTADRKSFSPSGGHKNTMETKSFADFLRRVAAEYVQNELTRETIRRITTTTREQIVAQIAHGDKEGWGVAKIARAMTRVVPSISRSRAALISRTETHNASSTGSFQAAKQVGIPLWKQWIAVSGDRTRDSHAEMSRDPIPMDEPFQVSRSDGGVDYMMHAGDRENGSAENTINCRCSIGYVRPPAQ